MEGGVADKADGAGANERAAPAVNECPIDPSLLKILRCPRCGSTLEANANALRCGKSGETFAVLDGVPLLWGDGERDTKLDLEYDKVHAINERASRQMGKDWHALLQEISHRPGVVLELGAGTGAFTKGFLELCAPDRLVATDVSQAFLTPLVAMLKKRGAPVEGVVYDANTNVFSEGSFDTVVGRSVLHHLLDYADTLRAAKDLLRDGGVAIFFEPVRQGKAIVSLMIALVLKAHEAGLQNVLSEEEQNKLRFLLKHQTKSGWLLQDRKNLKAREDKFIFHRDELLALGSELGYSRSSYHDAGAVDQTYWVYFKHHVAMLGIAPETIQSLRWVCEAFGESYGLVLSDDMVRPMGFFVFQK